MIVLKNIWKWIKANWKWLLFPIGIISVVVAYFIGRRPTPDPDPILDEASEEAMRAMQEAARKRDEALKKLKEEHTARLQTLSVEQNKELEALKDQPIENIVAWFDALR